MIITKTHPQPFGVRQRTLQRTLTVGPISARFLTVALLAVLALFYLIQSSQGESNGFKVNQLLSEQQRLEQEAKRLELESIRLRSLNEIKKGSTDMEPVKELNHLPEGGAVSVAPTP